MQFDAMPVPLRFEWDRYLALYGEGVRQYVVEHGVLESRAHAAGGLHLRLSIGASLMHAALYSVVASYERGEPIVVDYNGQELVCSPNLLNHEPLSEAEGDEVLERFHTIYGMTEYPDELKLTFGGMAKMLAQSYESRE